MLAGPVHGFTLSTGEESFPTELSKAAVAAHPDGAYIFGGYDGSKRLDTIYLTSDADIDLTLVGHLPAAKKGMTAARVGDQILLLGGDQAGGENATAIWEFNATDASITTWDELLPHDFSRGRATVLDGRVYATWMGTTVELDPVARTVQTHQIADWPAPDFMVDYVGYDGQLVAIQGYASATITTWTPGQDAAIVTDANRTGFKPANSPRAFIEEDSLFVLSSVGGCGLRVERFWTENWTRAGEVCLAHPTAPGFEIAHVRGQVTLVGGGLREPYALRLVPGPVQEPATEVEADGAASLAWNAPEMASYASLLGYTVELQGPEEDAFDQFALAWQRKLVGPDELSIAVEGLRPGTHSFAIAATNYWGAGPEAVVDVVIPSPPAESSPTSTTSSTISSSTTSTTTAGSPTPSTTSSSTSTATPAQEAGGGDHLTTDEFSSTSSSPASTTPVPTTACVEHASQVALQPTDMGTGWLVLENGDYDTEAGGLVDSHLSWFAKADGTSYKTFAFVFVDAASAAAYYQATKYEAGQLHTFSELDYDDEAVLWHLGGLVDHPRQLARLDCVVWLMELDGQWGIVDPNLGAKHAVLAGRVPSTPDDSSDANGSDVKPSETEYSPATPWAAAGILAAAAAVRVRIRR